MDISIKRKVYDVGVNDLGYKTMIREKDKCSKSGYKVIWTCPFYKTWTRMLRRCYSKKYQVRSTTYVDCTVSEDWKLFSNFRSWMILQDWEGKELDKDILFRDNRVYSANTCVFVTQQVNNFILESNKSKGEWSIGVSWDKVNNKFRANCSNPFTHKVENLGRFACQYEAHAAWLARKLEHAYALAAIQTDQRVAKALIERYEGY